MHGHTRLGAPRGAIVFVALLVLTAVTLAAADAPARAFRSRTTPAQAATLAAAQNHFGNPGEAARHDVLVTRIVARHTAAFGTSGAALPARGRLHQPLALTPHGALAVATLAALAAICLVALAVVIGTRREDALRRNAAAKARRGVATERRAG